MATTGYINKNVTVIIRSVGERTTELCFELVKKQVAEDNIHIIRETPFTEALRKTFEIGLRENRKWTFVVDADLLIRPDAMKDLVSHAETLEENVFEIEGKVIDKFLDSPREAGNHLYRTMYMEKAVEYISSPLNVLRPETLVKEKMRENGYPWYVFDRLIGLHDFEQFYIDIFRKSFVQAKKHRERVLRIQKKWQLKSNYDRDFVVAIAGFQYGLNNKATFSIDASYNSLFKNELGTLNIREKNKAISLFSKIKLLLKGIK